MRRRRGEEREGRGGRGGARVGGGGGGVGRGGGAGGAGGRGHEGGGIVDGPSLGDVVGGRPTATLLDAKEAVWMVS